MNRLFLCIITLLYPPFTVAAPVQLVPGSTVMVGHFYGIGKHLTAHLNDGALVNATASNCPSQTVNWSSHDASVVCSGMAGMSTHNNTVLVTASAGRLGQARFQCNGFTGAYTFLSAQPNSCN